MTLKENCKLLWTFIVFYIMAVECRQCTESKPGMLNVHLVSHTHDDVGWLKTVDQYYYGANNTIQRAGVQYILDSVVRALLDNPDRKFIYVESAFFYRWWNQQTSEMQQTVKNLVSSGQLEFIGGGWCMNDEAASHYNAIIDQMTLGLMKLNATFGDSARPRIAWQIDPFGHSREQASLFAQMGFDGLFFGRLDYDDKRNRWKNKQMEMIWQASENLGEASWLFTGALPNGYGPPKGFCFDILCDDDPIMDDPNLHDYNVDQKVSDFLSAAHEEAKGYATSDIIMTMGMDFHYQNAHVWFKNLDKLIRYVNQHQGKGSKVNVMYSTPSCYLDALHATGKTWPTKQDDFFPYASDHHAYWTGYFTSRPTLKGYVRTTNSFLQAVKQVSALAGFGSDDRLELLKEAMAVAQHHDAVSGTAKQHVTDDYALRLSNGVTGAYELMQDAVRKIRSSSNSQTLEWSFCPLLNVSSCPQTENSEIFVVSLYNPLARPRNQFVRLPVPPHYGYKIIDHQGNSVTAQLLPLPESLKKIPGRSGSTSLFDLVFLAENIPALGEVQYHISRTSNIRILRQQLSKIAIPSPGEDINISQGRISLTIDGLAANVMKIQTQGETDVNKRVLSQEIAYYEGMVGNNSKEEFRASGAYIFRPDGKDPKSLAHKLKIKTVTGPVLTEIQQEWSPWVSQVVRIYSGAPKLEMEWLVGPVPISDSIGKEVINRVTLMDMDTHDTFFTDANGREILMRVKDHRFTWHLNNTEPVAGNYYPVNSRIILKDAASDFKFAVMTDRSQGGTSLNSGQAELMIHRRLLHDDAFGVGEPLNETQFGEGLIVRGKHHILLSDFSTPACDFGCLHRSLGQELLLQPVISIAPTSMDHLTWRETQNTLWSGLKTFLPASIHLLTLEPLKENMLLIRLEHMYEERESQRHSDPVKLNLKNLLYGWEIVTMRETNLSGNQWKEDEQRLKWNVEQRHETQRDTGYLHKSSQDSVITLHPMEIKTFIITVKKTKFKLPKTI